MPGGEGAPRWSAFRFSECLAHTEMLGNREVLEIGSKKSGQNELGELDGGRLSARRRPGGAGWTAAQAAPVPGARGRHASRDQSSVAAALGGTHARSRRRA